MKSFVERYQTV